MKKHTLTSAMIAGVFMFGLPQAQACGEGQFNMGGGLQYQAYLAPRPATVLIYPSADPSDTAAKRLALVDGLRKAGHRVTVVTDQAGLTSALREQHYDVLIAAYADIDMVNVTAAASGASPPKLLPVVARSQRNAEQLHNRFALFLVDGASLGQYLKTINLALPAKSS